MKTQWAIVVGLIIAIIIAVFATVNVTDVPIDYVFGEARWPLILVILGSVFAGFIISFCFSAVRMIGAQRRSKQIQKELEQNRVLLNEKDTEIIRLKDELSAHGASAFVVEDISNK